jgi:hypothetical protein
MKDLVPLQPLQYIMRPVPAAEIGDHGELAWLSLEKLYIDARYQRDILDSGKTNIRKIIENFNWRKFGVLVVGKRERGQYAVVDGQHRAVAALMHGGIKQVPCLVLTGGLQLEAATFSAINSAVTRISPLQSFHANVAAGDPNSIALVELCTSLGVTIVRRPKVDFAAGETMALALLRTTFNKDQGLLSDSLQLLRALDPQNGLGADHLRGTIQALEKLDMPLADPKATGEALAAAGNTATKLMEAAWSRKMTRGGTSFQNFSAVLLEKIKTSQRASPSNMKRMMAGK